MTDEDSTASRWRFAPGDLIEDKHGETWKVTMRFVDIDTGERYYSKSYVGTNITGNAEAERIEERFDPVEE